MSRSRYVKRPRVGEVLETLFGPSMVDAVHDYGRRLELSTVNSPTGWTRHFELERADTGHWLRDMQPCQICREDTSERVYNVDGGRGWSPMCLDYVACNGRWRAHCDAIDRARQSA